MYGLLFNSDGTWGASAVYSEMSGSRWVYIKSASDTKHDGSSKNMFLSKSSKLIMFTVSDLLPSWTVSVCWSGANWNSPSTKNLYLCFPLGSSDTTLKSMPLLTIGISCHPNSSMHNFTSCAPWVQVKTTGTVSSVSVPWPEKVVASWLELYP